VNFRHNNARIDGVDTDTLRGQLQSHTSCNLCMIATVYTYRHGLLSSDQCSGAVGFGTDPDLRIHSQKVRIRIQKNLILYYVP
jgi:hypothetical protein